MANFCT